MNPYLVQIIQLLNDLKVLETKNWWDKFGSTVLAALSLSISAFTLKYLIDYTKRTTGLLNEARLQNEGSVMPILMIVRDPDVLTIQKYLQVRNIGKGPAFNVSFDQSVVDGRMLKAECLNNLIEVNSTVSTTFMLVAGNGKPHMVLFDQILFDSIRGRELPDPLKLVVRCESVSAKKYAFTFDLTGGAIIFVQKQSLTDS